MDTIDWDHIRRNARAVNPPPPGWPADVAPISQVGLRASGNRHQKSAALGRPTHRNAAWAHSLAKALGGTGQRLASPRECCLSRKPWSPTSPTTLRSAKGSPASVRASLLGIAGKGFAKCLQYERTSVPL